MPTGPTLATLVAATCQASTVIRSTTNTLFSCQVLLSYAGSYQKIIIPIQRLLAVRMANELTRGIWVWNTTAILDSAGPSNFYTGIENLIAYNCSVAAGERISGLQADIEPQDDGTHTSFHNEVADSGLSTTLGSGEWQPTQTEDREMLMRSWLTIHQTARGMLHARGLRFGAAMPFWTHSYCGEEVKVNFPRTTNKRQGVMKYMMPLLDEYVVMSYNTSPSNAASRVAVQAAYASTLPAELRPCVCGSMEMSTGVGENVSYGDTTDKNSKAVVMQDMAAMNEALRQHSAFKGIAFHHWSSWQVMPE